MSACCAPGASRHPSDQHPTFRSAPLDTDASARMAAIPAGLFRMGNDDERAIPGDGEGPVRDVWLSSYFIERRCVTNAQFAGFVRATNYVTDAARYGWSFVFHDQVVPGARIIDRTVPDAPWWRAVTGATWDAPEGPGSTIERRWRHPVVHVSWNDASAYASWANRRLPTEAEWEKAARGGLEGARFPWGDELTPDGQHRANIWQGRFPEHDTAEDGYHGTAPVDAFTSNGYGLYNVAGNVWEWCWDRWSNDWHHDERTETRQNPLGPKMGDHHVLRGGSYLCHASYCERYRVGARTHNSRDTSTGHTGFRVAADPPSSSDSDLAAPSASRP